jgi:hypothetical protein
MPRQRSTCSRRLLRCVLRLIQRCGSSSTRSCYMPVWTHCYLCSDGVVMGWWVNRGRQALLFILTCARVGDKSNDTMPRTHAERGDTRGSMGGGREAGNCSERACVEQILRGTVPLISKESVLGRGGVATNLGVPGVSLHRTPSHPHGVEPDLI